MDQIAVFLRGINLGRRRLKSEELKRPFADAGFEHVRTFLASGNVVIRDPGLGLQEVEARVEEAFAQRVGFEAGAFARPLLALDGLADDPEIRRPEEEGFTPHVIFLKKRPEPKVRQALEELETPDDRFRVLERHVVWLRRGRMSDSQVQPRHLEGALGGVPNTMRKITTLRRLVAKFGR